MLHIDRGARPSRRPLATAPLVVLTLALALVACGQAAAPSTTPPGADPTARPTPTAVPGDAGSGGTGVIDPGGGNVGGGGEPGNPGNPGAGGGIPLPPDPDPGDEIWQGAANPVEPQAGLVNQRPVNVQGVRAVTNDDGVVAELRWWSGVAPCNALDSVEIEQDDAARTIRLTVIEGSAPGDQMCIEIAELKATFVDLGVLGAGEWQISAEGDAPAITVEV